MGLMILQSLRTEIDNHEPRIHLVCNNGQKLIDEGHEDAPEFTNRIEDLLARWQQLKDAVETRRNKLLQSEKAQQVGNMHFYYLSYIYIFTYSLLNSLHNMYYIR